MGAQDDVMFHSLNPILEVGTVMGSWELSVVQSHEEGQDLPANQNAMKDIVSQEVDLVESTESAIQINLNQE